MSDIAERCLEVARRASEATGVAVTDPDNQEQARLLRAAQAEIRTLELTACDCCGGFDLEDDE